MVDAKAIEGTSELGNGLWGRLESTYDAEAAYWDTEKKRLHKVTLTNWNVKRSAVSLVVNRHIPRGLLARVGVFHPTMTAMINEYSPATETAYASRGRYRLDLVGQQLVQVSGAYFEAPDVIEGDALKPNDWQLVDSMQVNPDQLLGRIAKALDYVIPVNGREK